MNEKINTAKIRLNEGKDILKQAFDENPTGVLLAGAAVLVGVSKLLTSVSSFNNSLVWRREVKRRMKK